MKIMKVVTLLVVGILFLNQSISIFAEMPSNVVQAI